MFVMPSKNETFDIGIFDYSSVAYCVVEVVLDDSGQPKDWIYRYCNQTFADLKGYRLEMMIDNSFSGLYPEMDEKWLIAYYQAAYEDIPVNVVTEKNNHVSIMPVGKRGLCSATVIKLPQENHRGIEADAMPVNEGYIIRKLSPEFVSLFRIDLNSGAFDILRMADGAGAKHVIDNAPHPFDNYDELCIQYADTFVSQEDREEFLEWHTCKNMKKRLGRTDKISYHYRSISKAGVPQYYEAYAVKGRTDKDTYQIFLGYRNVDSILYKERAIQKKLQDALDEARLGNEIISAIAKTYQYILRIDIMADWYEDLSEKSMESLMPSMAGVVSADIQKVCRMNIAEEYQEAFLQFTDITTLPERMRDEESIVMTYRMKDGNWHRLRFIEKKRDEDGRLTHVVCAVRSISDEKRREHDLMYQVAEAKKESAVKTRFLSNMSHDIRTPLNGIIGMLEIAEHYPGDMEMQKKCRDKIMESARHLVSLMNDILDLNKLESGDIVEHELKFDLAEVLRRANTAKQTMAEEKGVEYIVDWGKGDMQHLCLIGNPIYLEKLLTAISDNAVKFTNPGGSVRVWCIEKSVDDDNALFEFGCSDTGIGMSPEFLSHAYDVFSQENETGRSRYEGTGLGLAIARKLVEHMGGKLEITSQKGVGTTAVMTIPFKIGEEEAVDRIKQSDVSIEGKRALVVEDNELNMDIVCMMLENNGITVERAWDGEEGVERFEESAPGYYDVIIMDILMPKMKGWDAARKIRAMRRNDAVRVPIIAVSANAFAEDIINSRIAGMNAHLTKPFQEKPLLEAIRSCMDFDRQLTGIVRKPQK